MSKPCCQSCGRRIPELHTKCASCRAKRTAAIKAGIAARRDREPTEAELDAMIAEQRQRLPAWWKEPGR